MLKKQRQEIEEIERNSDREVSLYPKTWRFLSCEEDVTEEIICRR